MAIDRQDRIAINPDVHVLIVGATGTGKSTIMRHLVRNARRTVIIDPKHEFASAGYQFRRTLPLFRRDFQIIHRPRLDGDANMARIVWQSLQRGNVRIVVDELATLVNFFPRTVEALSEVMRIGRSRNVSAWNATQRPRRVPRIFLSEARAVIMFPLMLGEDRRYMAEILGPRALEPLGQHDFLYINTSDGMFHPRVLHLDMTANRIRAVDGGHQHATAG